MTVWVVTMNGYVWDVCASVEAAAARMEAIKALPRYAHEQWRPVGQDGWSSPAVTSLERSAYTVEC